LQTRRKTKRALLKNMVEQTNKNSFGEGKNESQDWKGRGDGRPKDGG